jgi:lipid-binding SYLF domain-containing protein
MALVSVWTGLLGLRVKVCGMGVSCGIGCDSVVLSVFVLQRPLVTLSALGTATAIEGFASVSVDGLGRIVRLELLALLCRTATHQTDTALIPTSASV